MRAKVVLPVLALSVLLIALALLLSQRNRDASGALPARDTAALLPSPRAQFQGQPGLVKRLSLSPEGPPARLAAEGDSTRDNHKTAVANRIAELNRLAMTSDPRSLDTILSELSNRDRPIRAAAVSATIDFGSRDAIPALQNALAGTDDLKEKVEIQRAIDFLQLPSALAQDRQSQESVERK
jgi:HEAT repeat protein